MTNSIDKEIEAIRAVLSALEPLSEKARQSVLDYITKRLNLAPLTPPADHSQGGMLDTTGMNVQDRAAPMHGSVHIKEFKEGKKPKSANEMAALIAYYLENLAPEENRKSTVNQKDIETYFKIAGYPLPKEVRVTLQNAKASGYFDLVGDGEYKLNAVGHNLVAHSMPKESSPRGRNKVSRSKIATKKKRGKSMPKKTQVKRK